jgi:uncharacterized protein YggE
MDSGIAVVGTGHVTAPADVLRLTLSVGHDAEDVAAAVSQVAQRTDAVNAALREQGVEEKDIHTSSVNVYPQYADSMKVAGYRASHSMTVTTKDLTGFGRLLNAAVGAVGNDLGLDGLQFDVSDKAPLLEQARELAFAQAREKADHLARLAGQSIGSIAGVSETYGSTPLPRSAAAGKGVSLAFDAAIAVAPGEQTVEVSLEVRWAWA